MNIEHQYVPSEHRARTPISVAPTSQIIMAYLPVVIGCATAAFMTIEHSGWWALGFPAAMLFMWPNWKPHV